MPHLRFRKREKLAPLLHVNLSRKLFSRRPWQGISFTLGGRWLSRNTRSNKWRGDLPGPFSWEGDQHEG